MARGGAKACGAGAAARRSGVGWSGGSATVHGATSDVLAARYLPEGQAEQPELQLESHEDATSQPESQPTSQPEADKKPSQLESQLESHVSGMSLRREGRGGGGVRRGKRRQEAREARAGRADIPAGVATRSQPPPIARAVDFARDRRFVWREGRVVRLAIRWERPAAGFGEHHREVEEHRVSGSLHRPASK